MGKTDPYVVDTIRGLSISERNSKKKRFDHTKSEFWPKEHCAAKCDGCSFRKDGKSQRPKDCHGPLLAYNRLASFAKHWGCSLEQADKALTSMSRTSRR